MCINQGSSDLVNIRVPARTRKGMSRPMVYAPSFFLTALFVAAVGFILVPA